jgi:hypothetical protein
MLFLQEVCMFGRDGRLKTVKDVEVAYSPLNTFQRVRAHEHSRNRRPIEVVCNICQR